MFEVSELRDDAYTNVAPWYYQYRGRVFKKRFITWYYCYHRGVTQSLGRTYETK